MLDAVPADLIGSVFCDSLEVYGADWTRALPAEFARRRGYDMLPVLYRLTVDEPGAARLRADYHHTLAELYQENFVAACQRWAAGRNVPFRIQSYRTPPATISSYRFADLFEGEGWGWREITQTRWASSAAHLYGRTVASAEVWTWVLRTGAMSDVIELALHPYEATVIVLSDTELSESGSAIALLDSDRSVPVRGPWRVAYGNEPAQPIDLPHIWEDEPGRRHYSGAASYTTSFDLDAVDRRVSIDLGDPEVLDGGATERGLVGPSYRVAIHGPVGEVAQVRVNGIDCGPAWAPPYRVEITDALRSGANEIEIIVYNTAANALAADEHIMRLAAKSEVRYGRRFQMQDLDRALESVRSGLLRVPTIVVSV
jgi:hypothetical protein